MTRAIVQPKVRLDEDPGTLVLGHAEDAACSPSCHPDPFSCAQGKLRELASGHVMALPSVDDPEMFGPEGVWAAFVDR